MLALQHRQKPIHINCNRHIYIYIYTIIYYLFIYIYIYSLEIYVIDSAARTATCITQPHLNGE